MDLSRFFSQLDERIVRAFVNRLTEAYIGFVAVLALSSVFGRYLGLVTDPANHAPALLFLMLLYIGVGVYIRYDQLERERFEEARRDFEAHVAKNKRPKEEDPELVP